MRLNRERTFNKLAFEIQESELQEYLNDEYYSCLYDASLSAVLEYYEYVKDDVFKDYLLNYNTDCLIIKDLDNVIVGYSICSLI